jgi:hypothetical protein
MAASRDMLEVSRKGTSFHAGEARKTGGACRAGGSHSRDWHRPGALGRMAGEIGIEPERERREQ